MNILLASSGRRPYLVKWFQEALIANNLVGNVVAADLDPQAPIRSFADEFVQAPAVTDSEYRSWLADTLREYKIDLAVSINDFELSEWAQLGEEPIWKPLVRLDAEVQARVEDKFVMSEYFEMAGIPTPKTWLGRSESEAALTERQFVTKGRFGSASRGLQFTDSNGLKKAVEIATEEVTDRKGEAALSQQEIAPADLVLVQELIKGSEYGLDVVCDLNGEFCSVLARRKIAMRGGETDRAESVSPRNFEEIARSIAKAVPHPGTIDVDVIVDTEGVPYVIDVNPRFGGGYPLSHVAGARVPNAYVAWAADIPLANNWFDYESGAIAGKYVETVRIR